MNKEKLARQLVTIELYIIQIALIIFKLQGKIDLSWVWVLFPILLRAVILISAFITLGVVTFILQQIEKDVSNENISR